MNFNFYGAIFMKISRYLSVGLATALLMCVFATTFGTAQATTVKRGSMTETTTRTTASTPRTKRQTMTRRRQRYSALTLKTSAKKTKRVPKAKSLSKESY
jgi:hypothetical protein